MPRRMPPRVLGLILAAVLAACSATPAATTTAHRTYQGVVLAQPTDKPEFVLTDTSGGAFDFGAETKGFLTLLYFGYTSCADICPTQMAQLAAVLAQDPALRPLTKVVFVSVDPARDTPEKIRSFLDRFDTSFIGLVGTPAQLEAAQQAAGVPVAVPSGPNLAATVDHAAQVLAYAPDGHGYTVYPFGSRQSQYAHDLPILSRIQRGA